ncbi:Predicted arabinose efflux permease, MFS family [Rhizobiales bacterium GAS113]|nr:Predicted arabinose efflux permease, MFS family [Rhizobiales bacterium GAS113]
MSLARTTNIAARFPLAWLIGGLGAGQIIGWGSGFYLPTILSRDISADIGLSEEVVFAGTTVMLLVSAMLSPWLGRSLDRGAARLIMTSGCVFAALALCLLGLSFDLKTYLFAWIVMGVSSSMLLANSAFVAVAQLAGAGARRAMTVLMLFTGVASSIAWPVLSLLDTSYGWRATCFMLAALQFFICAPFHWWLLRRRIEPVAASMPSRLLQEGLPPERRRMAMRILVPCMCLSGFISWGLSVHIVDLLRHLGAESAEAIWLASLLGILQVSARLIDLAMGARHSPLLTGIVASTLLSLSFAITLIPWSGGPPPLIFMMVYGVASGSMSLARVMIPLSLFGSRSYGRTSGLLAAFQNVAYALAPLVYAALFARAGTAAALWLSFGAGFVTLIGMIVLFKMRRG